jgi:hypothetical protein
MLKKVCANDADADLVAKVRVILYALVNCARTNVRGIASLIFAISWQYTVLAGTYCLLRYVENCEGRSFGKGSLRIVYCTSQRGRMVIDRRTGTLPPSPSPRALTSTPLPCLSPLPVPAINLELVVNARTGNQKESLFGAINHTKTTVGARFLRAEILRPSTDRATLGACPYRPFRCPAAPLPRCPALALRGRLIPLSAIVPSPLTL